VAGLGSRLDIETPHPHDALIAPERDTRNTASHSGNNPALPTHPRGSPPPCEPAGWRGAGDEKGPTLRRGSLVWSERGPAD
jgi:hypothetical protein